LTNQISHAEPFNRGNNNLSYAETGFFIRPRAQPFVENRADRSRLSLPGLFDISRNKPVATIVEEPNLKEELPEETSILSSEILGNTLNSQQLPQNLTSPPSRNNRRMPSTPHMPLALSPSAPRWDGRARNLWTYIRLVERMLAATEITDEQQKLRWLTEYVDPDINDQWTSFEEYTRGDWDGFIGRLKSEYPEITTEEQGSMDQLRRLCRETPEIGLAEEERLLDFKRKFFFIAQKCLKPPAITGNRELVEYFMWCLDVNFRKALNSRLSL